MNLIRRQFLSGLAAVSGLAALNRPLKAQPAGRPPEGKYVDVHVHITQPWNERGELTARRLVAWMDEREVRQAWVLPLISPEAWFFPITTEFVLEETRPFRDRLIPFCIIDPRTSVFGGKSHFVDLLKRYKQAGARGFGEHKWGGPVDDPRNIALMQACGEVGLPVLFHLDNDRNTDQPGLPGLEKLLEAAPKTTFIGHGPGWWASISGLVKQADLGGYPRGDVAPGGALDRLLERFPNLYADLSAGSGHNAIRRDLEFGREFLQRHSRQILFGTDYLAEKQTVNQFDLFHELELPAEVEARIFRENAESLIAPEG